MQLKDISIPTEQHFFSDLCSKAQLLRVHFTENSIHHIEIEMTCGMQEWIDIQHKGLFSFRKEICGPIMGGEFKAFKDDARIFDPVWEPDA